MIASPVKDSVLVIELFKVIVEVITKQLDEVEKNEVKLEANLVIDYFY